jgi:hypothetical protein
LDFDRAIVTTLRGTSEGATIGYRKEKRSAGSYYPLSCPLARTGQVFDFYHRPSIVHESAWAREFILCCIQILQEALLWGKMEVGMDSAFFSKAIM